MAEEEGWQEERGEEEVFHYMQIFEKRLNFVNGDSVLERAGIGFFDPIIWSGK